MRPLILFLVDTDQVAKKPPFQTRYRRFSIVSPEDELWSKLEQERLESNDVERISDAWAKLEVGIIEDETKMKKRNLHPPSTPAW